MSHDANRKFHKSVRNTKNLILLCIVFVVLCSRQVIHELVLLTSIKVHSVATGSHGLFSDYFRPTCMPVLPARQSFVHGFQSLRPRCGIENMILVQLRICWEQGRSKTLSTSFAWTDIDHSITSQRAKSLYTTLAAGSTCFTLEMFQEVFWFQSGTT